MLNRWLGGSSDKKTGVASRSSNGSAPHGAHLKPSIISEGVAVDGDFKTEHGILHLDGSIVGNVRVSALIIGPTGHLDGTVEATSITVRGVLIGLVVCEELVLDATARVSGSIRYRTLAISGGALIEGALVRLIERAPVASEYSASR